jgi:hypothetical protein
MRTARPRRTFEVRSPCRTVRPPSSSPTPGTAIFGAPRPTRRREHPRVRAIDKGGTRRTELAPNPQRAWPRAPRRINRSGANAMTLLRRLLMSRTTQMSGSTPRPDAGCRQRPRALPAAAEAPDSRKRDSRDRTRSRRRPESSMRRERSEVRVLAAGLAGITARKPEAK